MDLLRKAQNDAKQNVTGVTLQDIYSDFLILQII